MPGDRGARGERAEPGGGPGAAGAETGLGGGVGVGQPGTGAARAGRIAACAAGHMTAGSASAPPASPRSCRPWPPEFAASGQEDVRACALRFWLRSCARRAPRCLSGGNRNQSVSYPSPAGRPARCPEGPRPPPRITEPSAPTGPRASEGRGRSSGLSPFLLGRGRSPPCR